MKLPHHNKQERKNMILEKVKELIAEQFTVDANTITEETDIAGDLGADSLDIVEFTMMLEEEFDAGEIGEDDLKTLRTVGDVVAFVAERTGEE